MKIIYVNLELFYSNEHWWVRTKDENVSVEGANDDKGLWGGQAAWIARVDAFSFWECYLWFDVTDGGDV